MNTPEDRSVHRWGDLDADDHFSTRRDASPAEVLREVRDSLGIGVRRVRYGASPPDLSGLKEEMGRD